MKSPFDPGFVRLLLDTHHRLLGTPKVPEERSLDEAARWLYEDAPFCVLAHTAEDDPRFFYANRAAQQCFGYSWEEFIQLPSRLSAETPHQDEREQFLQTVAEQGFALGYRGQRIARSGQRFWIDGVKVWNLVDDAGQHLGQAATYLKWSEAA